MRGEQTLALTDMEIAVAQTVIDRHVIDSVLLEEFDELVRILFGQHLLVGLVSFAGSITHRPGKVGPAVINSAPIHQNRMMNKLFRQKDVAWLRVLEKPVRERVVTKRNVDPVIVMNAKEINRTGRDDNCAQ